MATTVTSSYLNRSTPGVYITEIDAFGSSIVGVATAVPIFIGYTQFAGDPVQGTPLYNQAVSISSMTEFINYFGGPAPQGFAVSVIQPPPPSSSGAPATPQTPSFVANYTTAATAGSSSPSGGPGYSVAPTPFLLASTAIPDEPSQFNLYWQMRLFFANGGNQCYVVSVGSYWTNEYPTAAPNPVPDTWMLGTIAAGAPDNDPPVPGLTMGLQAASYVIGPTMIVIPEACMLPVSTGDYGAVVQGMLQLAGQMQDRVAILDLPGVLTADSLDDLTTAQSNLATAVGPQAAYLSYGCCYGPALNTTIVGVSDILYTNLVAADGGDNSVINNILTTQANLLYGGNAAQLGSMQAAIASAFPLTGAGAGTNTAMLSGSATGYPAPLPGSSGLTQWQGSLDNLLLNSLPVFKQIEQQIATMMNVAPPSGALAGVWTKSDGLNGVWNAPANFALAAVDSPLYNMSDAEQGGFNVPLNGQAIDIIRSQPGRGNVVWGARTLDGNSMDYRYIQVRRTLIFVEQSIKLALQSFVFAANDATTWTTVVATISNFLTGVWQQGGLMGAKPTDAFTVQCGLGQTMTSQNILDGYMVVAVTLQMIHPAEFIELTFTQTMGS
jgi:phage tail sheath protein FI